MSSVMPSEKYSCSGIAAHVVEGQHGDRWPRRLSARRLGPRRAGRRGRVEPATTCRPAPAARCSSAAARRCPRRRGRAGCRHGRAPIRRRRCRPARRCSRSRAATLTPSPKMSSSSTMMSPRLMPMRNSMRRSSAHVGIALAHAALDLGGAGDRVHHARELDQHAVAGQLDDAALVLGDPGVDQLACGAPSGRPACPPRRRPSGGCSRRRRRRGSR